ncbi:MAG: ABC transporter substrate-binding protein [Candidatus Latescibacteria bacterium]|nr:ABC transporter substrate-binding protein [Candidatus Latescibacterota bacterium]
MPNFAEGQARTWTYSADAENIFGNGLEAYKQGRFDETLNHLGLLAEFPLNQRSSAGQFLLGKTLYRLGRFAEAINAALVLQRRFPTSRYLPNARLLIGDSFFNSKHYSEAASQYGRLLATQAPLGIQAQAAERLAAMYWNGQLKEQERTRLRQAVGAVRLREALFFGRARWYQRLGWQEEAAQAMQTYRDSVANGIFAPIAAVWGSDLTAYSPRVGERSPRLGLLLPLTGPDRRTGEELRDGVRLANREAGSPFELVDADTGVDYGNLPIATGRSGDVSESPASGLLRVAYGAQRLLDQGVVAIVGPLHSSSSVVAATVAARAGVPLLVPLAQQSGLDALGHSVFQLKTVSKTEARLLGEYATLVLGLEHLAIISPLSDYGLDFAREFTRIAERNGGQIAHSDWYIPKETTDFRRVFEEIRAAGLALMPPPVDTLEVVEEEPEEDKFIDTIDGVVVVVESFADAKTIAPQVHFHRLQTQILGNDAWWNPEAIRQMRPGERKNFDGVIFVSKRQPESAAERSFVSTFRKQFRRDPLYAATGYDATHLLIDGWEQGHRDPAALVEWLTTVRFYEGASGVISLSPDVRSNSALTLLKIERDKVRSLGTGDLPQMGAAE